MIGIDFCKWSLSSGKHVIYAYFSVSFYMSEYWILLRTFSVYDHVLFLQWPAIVVNYIDFQTLNQPCVSRINPIWLWCTILFVFHYILFANILFRIFGLYSLRILACSFLSEMYLSGFGIIKWIREYVSSLLFFRWD